MLAGIHEVILIGNQSFIIGPAGPGRAGHAMLMLWLLTDRVLPEVLLSS